MYMFMRQRIMLAMAAVVAAVTIGWVGFGRGEGDVVSAESITGTMAAGTPKNTITVGASGSIMVEPDVAYLSLAVETRGAKATEAQQANAVKFAGVESTLYEKFGIDKKDVKTTGFNVQPEYNYTEKDGQVLKGYIATHQVQVTYRKLTEIGKLFDALTASGANRLDGVQFATEKKDAYELEALKKAMASAATKAGVLATSANRQLKGAINIVQGDVANTPIIYNGSMAKAEMSSMSDAATSVQSGQIEITTQVTVQYEMQ